MPIIFCLSDRETGQLEEWGECSSLHRWGGSIFDFFLKFKKHSSAISRYRIRDAKSKIGHFLVHNCFELINFQSNSLC
jgi:hypothetical protein